MKTIITSFFVGYLWLMFTGIGIILFSINGLNWNPWQINTDAGAQLLFIVMMIMAVVAMWCIMHVHVENTKYENNRVYYTRDECIQEYGKVFGPSIYMEQFPLWWKDFPDADEVALNALESQSPEY